MINELFLLLIGNKTAFCGKKFFDLSLDSRRGASAVKEVFMAASRQIQYNNKKINIEFWKEQCLAPPPRPQEALIRDQELVWPLPMPLPTKNLWNLSMVSLCSFKLKPKVANFLQNVCENTFWDGMQTAILFEDISVWHKSNLHNGKRLQIYLPLNPVEWQN